jgi:hypothetical protein
VAGGGKGGVAEDVTSRVPNVAKQPKFQPPNPKGTEWVPHVSLLSGSGRIKRRQNTSPLLSNDNWTRRTPFPPACTK